MGGKGLNLLVLQKKKKKGRRKETDKFKYTTYAQLKRQGPI
jgi:hypothetical protein